MAKRKELIIKSIMINGRFINRIVIDPHVEKHKDITDELILKIVQKMNGV